jgi:branched-chain amino acid transport system substrate-binding protein
MERMSVDGGRSGRLQRLARGAASSLILLLTACGGSDVPVVFGAAAPLEASYGASMRQGAELAQQEINDAGGIRGRPLELRFRDDRADPQVAPGIAEAFFQDPQVVAVVGHVNSGTMTAAAFIYQQGLPAVATSATSPGISRLGEWIFRVASSDSANAVALAQHARGFATPTAVLYENDDYGRGLADSFRSALAGAGTRVVQSDPYLDTTEDLTPYLQRLRRHNTGLVFIAGLEEGAARIIRQAREVGLEARFLGGDGVEGLVEMGSEFDGTRVGLLFHPDATPAARAFATGSVPPTVANQTPLPRSGTMQRTCWRAPRRRPERIDARFATTWTGLAVAVAARPSTASPAPSASMATEIPRGRRSPSG